MQCPRFINRDGEDRGADRARTRPAGEIIMSLMIFRRTFNVRVSIMIFGIEVEISVQ